MKIDMTPLQYLMERFHLGKDNTHTKTWCSDNINYMIKYVMFNVLTCIHNFSIDRKFEVNLYAHFKY